MAPNATIYRLELQASDMDRHYYAEHALTLAQHPSETPERLMARLIAFVLFADERLEFGRGLGNEEDPALWQRDYGGEIEHWIDLGQPDESRIRKACGRARQVTVVNYGGHAAELWWNRQAATLGKLKNLSVIELDPQAIDAALPLLERSMRLTSMIQDGELQLMNDRTSIALTPRERMPAAA
jgi:uncharacterized protein YaeQ